MIVISIVVLVRVVAPVQVGAGIEDLQPRAQAPAPQLTAEQGEQHGQ